MIMTIKLDNKKYEFMPATSTNICKDISKERMENEIDHSSFEEYSGEGSGIWLKLRLNGNQNTMMDGK